MLDRYKLYGYWLTHLYELSPELTLKKVEIIQEAKSHRKKIVDDKVSLFCL